MLHVSEFFSLLHPLDQWQHAPHVQSGVESRGGQGVAWVGTLRLAEASVVEMRSSRKFGDGERSGVSEEAEDS